MPSVRTLSIESPALRLAVQGLGVALLSLVLIYVLSGKELPLLLAALAGLFCLLLFRNPHWGVLAIFTFWFCRYTPTLLGSRYLLLSHIIAVLLFVPLALRLLRDREIWVWRVPQVRYLLAIGGIFFVSAVWADYKYPITFLPELDRTFEMSQDFITHLVFLVFFLYFINTRRKLEFFTWLVVALIVVSVADAYSRLFLLSGLRRVNASFGLGKSPTVFPYVCLFGASLLWCYYSAAQTTRWKGWVPPLLAGIPVIALATGSRTALLQLMTLATMVFLDRSAGWSSSKRIRGLVLLGCVGILMGILMSLVVPQIAMLRSTSFESTAGAPGAQSLKDRAKTVYAGLSMAASDPILGVGIGNFLWIHTASYGLKRFPHNSYLGALAEGGVGVLALYLLLFYATYRMLRQLELNGPLDLLWLAKGFRFNLILLSVYSLTDDAWLQGLPYLIIAATIAMYRLWGAQLPSRVPDHHRPIASNRPAESLR